MTPAGQLSGSRNLPDMKNRKTIKARQFQSMNKWSALIKEASSSKKNGVPLCICFAFWLCKSPARWKERTRCKVDASSQPEKTWLPFGILSCNGEKDQAVLCQQSRCSPSQSSAAWPQSSQIEAQTSRVKVKAGLLKRAQINRNQHFNFCIFVQRTRWSFWHTAHVNHHTIWG